MTKYAYRQCPSRLLGRAILDAWLCGDHLRLSYNLENARSLKIRSTDVVERDRLEALKSIAQRMSSTPDLSAARADDPRIGSWVSLLDHLAKSDGRAC